MSILSVIARRARGETWQSRTPGLLRRFASRNDVFIVFLLLLLPAPVYAEDIPVELQEVGVAEQLGAAVPLDTVFRDETGQSVPLGQYFDDARPVILVLQYFECPMLCGLVMQGVHRALRELDWTVGKEFQYVGVSIDPDEGHALAASKHASVVSAYDRGDTSAGWHFLVGDEPQIKALADAVGFAYHYDASQDEFGHAAVIMVLTPDGKISRYLFGIEFRPRDVRLALLEATEGKIGNIVDRFLLFCYHYDPASRTYGLMATRLMKAGGAITIVALGLLVFGLRRRHGSHLTISHQEHTS